MPGVSLSTAVARPVFPGGGEKFVHGSEERDSRRPGKENSQDVGRFILMVDDVDGHAGPPESVCIINEIVSM